MGVKTITGYTSLGVYSIYIVDKFVTVQGKVLYIYIYIVLKLEHILHLFSNTKRGHKIIIKFSLMQLKVFPFFLRLHMMGKTSKQRRVQGGVAHL